MASVCETCLFTYIRSRCIMRYLKSLRRLGLSVRSSWAASIALLADHVVLQELGVILEFLLELELNVSFVHPAMIFEMHLRYQVHQPIRLQRTLAGMSATLRTPSDPA